MARAQMANQRPEDLLQGESLIDRDDPSDQRQRDKHPTDSVAMQARPRPGRGQRGSPGHPDGQGLPSGKLVGQRLRSPEGRDRLGLVTRRPLAATRAHRHVEILLKRRSLAKQGTPPDEGRRS